MACLVAMATMYNSLRSATILFLHSLLPWSVRFETPNPSCGCYLSSWVHKKIKRELWLWDTELLSSSYVSVEGNRERERGWYERMMVKSHSRAVWERDRCGCERKWTEGDRYIACQIIFLTCFSKINLNRLLKTKLISAVELRKWYFWVEKNNFRWNLSR